MFTSIAPRYDLLNHVLSFNIDRLWWRRTARTFAHILSRPEAQVLDLCCGTGDMTLALRRQAGKSSPRILGADFSHAMLQRASRKVGSNALRWIEADACACLFPTVISIWSRPPSASAIWPITMPGCRRSCASCARAENSAFWISASPKAWWEVVPDLFQTRPAGHRHADLRSERAIRLSARIGRAFSRARAKCCSACERDRLPRSIVDPIHPGHRRPISRKKVSVVAPASRCGLITSASALRQSKSRRS